MINITRQNHRYRGPQESRKLLSFSTDVAAALKELNDKYNTLNQEIVLLKSTKIDFRILDSLNTIENRINLMGDVTVKEKL